MNRSVLNPFDVYPPLLESSYVEGFNAKIWSSSGHSSSGSAVFIIMMHGLFLHWPIYRFTTKSLFRIGPIRSDWILSTAFHVILPTLLFTNRNSFFGTLKLISIFIGNLLINILKYNLPTDNCIYGRSFWCFQIENDYIRKLRTFITYGALLLNCLEAILWEFFFLQGKYYNYINASAGLLQLFPLIINARKIGAKVTHTLNGDGDFIEMRSNLTFFQILAYTIWNIEYMSAFFPFNGAACFIFASLIIPFLSIFAGVDWLECRSKALGGMFTLGLMSQFFGLGAYLSTLRIGINITTNEGFRCFMSIFSFLVTILSLFEAIFLICPLDIQSEKLKKYFGILKKYFGIVIDPVEYERKQVLMNSLEFHSDDYTKHAQ